MFLHPIITFIFCSAESNIRINRIDYIIITASMNIISRFNTFHNFLYFFHRNIIRLTVHTVQVYNFWIFFIFTFRELFIRFKFCIYSKSLISCIFSYYNFLDFLYSFYICFVHILVLMLFYMILCSF